MGYLNDARKISLLLLLSAIKVPSSQCDTRRYEGFELSIMLIIDTSRAKRLGNYTNWKDGIIGEFEGQRAR